MSQQNNAGEARAAKKGDLSHVMTAIRSRGVAGAFRRVGHVLTWRLHTYLDRNYDRDHGVETSSHAFSWNLRMRSEGDDIGTEEPMYLPTSTMAFHTAMRNLPEDLSEFTFVDYGSGKGRTLLLASEYPFKKVIGVEFADELHEAAAKNIAQFKSDRQRSNDLESVLHDATTYEIPAGKCVLYFFNPFEQEALSKVVEQIRHSYLANPRKMYLVYYKPKHPELLTREDFLTEMSSRNRSRLGIPSPYGLSIFETPAV